MIKLSPLLNEIRIVTPEDIYPKIFTEMVDWNEDNNYGDKEDIKDRAQRYRKQLCKHHNVSIEGYYKWRKKNIGDLNEIRIDPGFPEFIEYIDSAKDWYFQYPNIFAYFRPKEFGPFPYSIETKRTEEDWRDHVSALVKQFQRKIQEEKEELYYCNRPECAEKLNHLLFSFLKQRIDTRNPDYKPPLNEIRILTNNNFIIFSDELNDWTFNQENILETYNLNKDEYEILVNNFIDNLRWKYKNNRPKFQEIFRSNDPKIIKELNREFIQFTKDKDNFQNQGTLQESINPKLQLFKTIAHEILEFMQSIEFRHSRWTYDEVRDDFCIKYGADPQEFAKWNNNRENLDEIKIDTETITNINQVKEKFIYELLGNYIIFDYIGAFKFDQRENLAGQWFRRNNQPIKNLENWIEQGWLKRTNLKKLNEIKIEPISVVSTYDLWKKLFFGGLKFTAFKILTDHGLSTKLYRGIENVIDFIKTLDRNELTAFYNDCKKEEDRLQDLADYPEQINENYE